MSRCEECGQKDCCGAVLGPEITDLKMLVGELEKLQQRYFNERDDLKRKLSDSIAREQEIERELDGCRSDVSTYRQQATNLRAHADALAGALDDMTKELGTVVVKVLQKDFEFLEATAPQHSVQYKDGVPFVRCDALTAYHNREE